MSYTRTGPPSLFPLLETWVVLLLNVPPFMPTELLCSAMLRVEFVIMPPETRLKTPFVVTVVVPATLNPVALMERAGAPERAPRVSEPIPAWALGAE